MLRRALLPAIALVLAAAGTVYSAFGAYENPRQLSVEEAPGKVLGAMQEIG